VARPAAIARAPIAERLISQLLAGPPARTPLHVAERLLAVQGQDARGARLAVRARSEGLSVADVDAALTDERSLLITWLNRGTLHMVASEDYPWLLQLTAPRLLGGCSRRLNQLGVASRLADRGVRIIERALSSEGPLDRLQLREHLRKGRVPTEGQISVHLLMLACLRGIAVRGPMIGAHHGYALVAEWLRPARPRERDRALAELARRYLAGHAPADDRDLARWSGLALRDVRAGLEAVGSELRERPDGLLEPKDATAPSPLPAPRLLGAFDPLLLGWCSREDLLGAHAPRITVGGMFRPFALVDGRAKALWGIPRGKISIEPLMRIAARDLQALERDGREVERFLAG
jgi:hypothetical protein